MRFTRRPRDAAPRPGDHGPHAGESRRCRDWGRLSLATSALLLPPLFSVTGCESMGPGSVTRDRFDYSAAVGDSWKSQMLLNLVKLRSGDIPVFMDVGQVVAGYSIQRTIGATASVPTFYQGAPINGITSTLGAAAGITYNDSPTITYTPRAGERFARSMMGSIPPASIMNVLQAGFPVDVVLRLAVQSINGLDNRRVAGGISREHVRPANPEFYGLLEQLGRIQNSGDIGVRAKGDQLTLVFRRSHSAAVRQAVRNVTSLLGLDPSATEFRIVYGAVPGNNREIALLTRSIFEVLLDISSTIIVPEAHVLEHRVAATPEGDLGPEGTIPPLIRISSSAERPGDTFAVIPFHDYWFWISDRDPASKNLFSFILLLFTFVETESKDITPVLAIPTTR
jgi:hypothetical protein